MNDRHDLALILDSHFPLVRIETHEEPRALDLLKAVVPARNKNLYSWSITEGLQALGVSGKPGLFSAGELRLQDEAEQSPELSDPQVLLRRIKKGMQHSVFVLIDFHAYLDDPKIVRLLKEIALEQYANGNTIVFLSHQLTVPAELSKLCASFQLSLPPLSRLEQMIIDEARLWSTRNNGQKVKADKKGMALLARNLLGLTVSDATRLIRNAIYRDGAITQDDLPGVMSAKYELIDQQGILSFEYDTASLAEVGGFSALKAWLKKREPHFLALEEQRSLDVPKGILLLGVQGSGKSLAAKAVAGMWGVPLLRMDFGALYNKFFGETERNIRETLKAAEVMAPCVLWIDEIEKGISTGDYDSGTSRRVLATLLTWMAENQARVFIVATANDIQALPPELVRKGRLDEIFFVDLPQAPVRQDIFAIHLRKRDQQLAAIDLARLAEASEGFSGAEIEQAVVAALYSAHAEQQALTTQHLLQEISNTQPLSVVMAEQIQSLRDWADGRTVPAD